MKLIIIAMLLFMKIIQLDCFKKEIIQSFANRNKYNCIVFLTAITNEFYAQKTLLELTKSLSSTILIPIIIINLKTERRNLKLTSDIQVCSKPLISIDSENSTDITENDVFFTSPLPGSLWLMFLPENLIVERVFSGIIIPINVEVIITKKNNSGYKFWHMYRPGLESPLIMRYYGNWTLSNSLMVPHRYLLWQKVTLNGITLRAATFKSDPFVNVSFRINHKYLMLTWLILENCLNFTTKYVPCIDNKWGDFKTNGNVTKGTGVIGMLIRKEADVSLLGFSLTSKRIRVIAYNIVLTQTRFQVYIKRDQNESKHWIRWWFSPLTTNSWYCVICNVLLIIAVLQLFSFVIKRFRIVCQQYPLDAFFQILTIIFQQGINNIINYLMNISYKKGYPGDAPKQGIFLICAELLKIHT
ncbi:uncharacterized protein LOC107265724 [Cephus cinctus]|uniref:Uncharacterized protein LOC107265724 n=1 Tax=Cephus cinctus TaxID=211228 RepID=A0AAJ7FGP7_CEPCN|nr:uncharacterized protein LOC107265724 [Cephus cinctus]